MASTTVFREISSSDVSVYPASNRSDSIDRYARLNIEHNLINIVNRLVGVDSFIVEGLGVNAAGNAVEAGLCNIHGYLFRLNQTMNLPTAAKGKTLGLVIRVAKNIDGKEQLINVNATSVSGDTSDMNNNFYGLQWASYEPVDGVHDKYPEAETQDYKTYVLPIAHCVTAGKWESIYWNDGADTPNRAFTQLFTLKQVQVQSTQAGTYSQNRQDLITFLEKNYIIDDGEIKVR